MNKQQNKELRKSGIRAVPAGALLTMLRSSRLRRRNPHRYTPPSTFAARFGGIGSYRAGSIE